MDCKDTVKPILKGISSTKRKCMISCVRHIGIFKYIF